MLAFSWRTSRFTAGATGRPLPPAAVSVVESRWLRGAVQAFGLAVAVLVAWAGLFGADSPANPVLGIFYIYLWVGLVPLSLLCGNVWPLLSPLNTVHRGLSRLTGSRTGAGLWSYPRWLGYWPAAAGLFTFVWTELVNPRAAYVSTVTTWLLLYAATMLIGGAVFGGAWLERADPFAVWFGLVATLAPWGRDASGELVVRNPLEGLDSVRADRGLVAVVAVVLGSTAFDSFSASTWWLTRTAGSNGFDPTLRDTAVLVGFCVLVALSSSAAAMIGTGLSGPSRRMLPTQLAHSLVPIGVGYVLAHYLTLLLESGQRYLVYLSDPLVTGRHDYLGTLSWEPVYFLSVRPGLVAGLKVAFVVVGHLAGVVAAHDRAVRVLPAHRAVAGQLAMLAVMLGYTVGGLLLLFSV